MMELLFTKLALSMKETVLFKTCFVPEGTILFISCFVQEGTILSKFALFKKELSFQNSLCSRRNYPFRTHFVQEGTSLSELALFKKELAFLKLALFKVVLSPTGTTDQDESFKSRNLFKMPRYL